MSKPALASRSSRLSIFRPACQLSRSGVHPRQFRRAWRAAAEVSMGLAVAFCANVAHSATSSSPADVSRAQALFERGKALMAEQREQEACPLFEESQRLDAGIGTQYNLARCYESVGRLASAYTLFLEVAEAARARGQAEREQVAAARARALESKLSRLIIEVEAQQGASLTVERDGSSVDSAQWGTALPLDPGRHEVRAHGPGLAPWVREINVGISPELHELRIPRLARDAGTPVSCEQNAGGGCAPSTLTPPDPAESPTSDRHTIGLVAMGAGVAALGLGTGLAIRAHSKNSSAEAAGCDDRGCPTQSSLSLRRSAISAGNWATVSTSLGIAGVAAAGLLLWVLPQPDGADSSSARLLPLLTDQTAGLDLRGRF
jgi:hypothetical protein